jgi:hypothetical protein
MTNSVHALSNRALLQHVVIFVGYAIVLASNDSGMSIIPLTSLFFGGLLVSAGILFDRLAILHNVY